MTARRRAIGAHYGVSEWAMQLLTAVVMILCMAYLAAAWLLVQPASHQQLAAFIGNDLVRLPLMLMILALVWHAWIGAKSVMMDYLPWDWFRLAKLAGAACYLVICLVWAAGTLWGGAA